MDGKFIIQEQHISVGNTPAVMIPGESEKERTFPGGVPWKPHASTAEKNGLKKSPVHNRIRNECATTGENGEKEKDPKDTT